MWEIVKDIFLIFVIPVFIAISTLVSRNGDNEKAWKIHRITPGKNLSFGLGITIFIISIPIVIYITILIFAK